MAVVIGDEYNVQLPQEQARADVPDSGEQDFRLQADRVSVDIGATSLRRRSKQIQQTPVMRTCKDMPRV